VLRPQGSIGGDLIVYLDFKQFFDLDARIQHALDAGRPEVVGNLRACQCKAGIAVVDVSGHRVTDAFLAATLHQAFLLGAVSELDMSGQVTKRLREPEYTVVSVMGREQVRLAHVRRDLGGRVLSVPVCGSFASARLFVLTVVV